MPRFLSLRGGGTRLTIRAAHVLRIDPVLYWEPIARWAIHQNIARVMEDVRSKAEAGGAKASDFRGNAKPVPLSAVLRPRGPR